MVDIRAELEKKINQSNLNATSLSDRLNYLDNFNKDVGVPQISSQGPKGYNPQNSLNALFQLISNRKSVATDLSNENNTGTDALMNLANYDKSNAVDPFDAILKKLNIEKAATDLGYTKDPNTGDFVKAPVSQEKQQLISNINDVLSRNTKPITGALRLGSIIPGSAGVTTKAKVEQIKSMLSLDARQKLKGQGQISDKETQMLADSVAALKYNMSDEDFRAELQKIRTVLDGTWQSSQESGGTQGQAGGLSSDDKALIQKYKNAGK